MSEHDPYLGLKKDDGSTHSRLERAEAALVRMGYAEDANRQLEVARVAMATCEAECAAMRETAAAWADLRRDHPRCCVEGCDNLVCEKHRQDAALIAAVDAWRKP